MSSKRRRVAIVAKSIQQYRRRFFELLRDRLARHNVDLLIVQGRPDSASAAKQDAIVLPWAKLAENRVVSVLGRKVLWQRGAYAHLRDVDLVIVEQATKLVLNYLLLARSRFGGTPVAFWGHGRNFQTERPGLGERIKHFVSRRVHWWFAYNDLSARIVVALGFPRERVTNVQNAIDTRELVSLRTSLGGDEVEELRVHLGLAGQNVCIYAGGLYAEKRIKFLLESAQRVRAQVADFELVVLGAGPDAHLVTAAAAEHKWIKYVGAKFDGDKVPYFALAKLFLLPGAVGLAVLDSFALEVPLVTSSLAGHGPEIDYLESGRNGFILENDIDPQRYADRVAMFLKDDALLERLRAGCRASRDAYSVEEMVDRFASGVLQALDS